MDFLRNLNLPAFKLTDNQRRVALFVFGVLAYMIVRRCVDHVAFVAAGPVNETDPAAAMRQAAASAMLLRAWAALGITFLVPALLALLWRWKDKMGFIRVLFVWDLDQDPEGVPAARILGACICLGLVVLGLFTLWSKVLG